MRLNECWMKSAQRSTTTISSTVSIKPTTEIITKAKIFEKNSPQLCRFLKVRIKFDCEAAPGTISRGDFDKGERSRGESASRA